MNLEEKVDKINALVATESWFDMEVLEMRSNNLVIIGSTDFTYSHSLEIKFIDVFHVSINSEWKTNTSRPILKMIKGEEALALNQKYKIEYGCILFKLIPEDLESFFFIAARNIEFNTDRVLYYKKDKLENNERLADWVK